MGRKYLAQIMFQKEGEKSDINRQEMAATQIMFRKTLQQSLSPINKWIFRRGSWCGLNAAESASVCVQMSICFNFFDSSGIYGGPNLNFELTFRWPARCGRNFQVVFELAFWNVLCRFGLMFFPVLSWTHATFLPFVVCLHRPPALPPCRTQGHHSLYSTSRSPLYIKH